MKMYPFTFTVAIDVGKTFMHHNFDSYVTCGFIRIYIVKINAVSVYYGMVI